MNIQRDEREDVRVVLLQREIEDHLRQLQRRELRTGAESDAQFRIFALPYLYQCLLLLAWGNDDLVLLRELLFMVECF